MLTINPKDRAIRLIVKANKLFNSNQTDSEIDECTSLMDDTGFGNAFGEPNKDFETIVFMNKKICWSIETADPNGEDRNYSVALTAVVHKPNPGNPQFFTKDPLTVNPGTGKVCGTIAKDPDLPEKDDSYTIEFNIEYNSPNGSTIMAIDLDPKLQIKKRD